MEDGFARIKAEYVLVDKKEDNKDVKKEGVAPIKPLEKRRGMDRQRKSKMLKAKLEMGRNEIRICHSVISGDDIKCKYGDKCLALHSKEEYWAKKPPDIGTVCPNFEQQGKCKFSLSCVFARDHTNPETLEQIEKEPNTSWKPTINDQTMKLQINLRKNLYKFERTEMALKEISTSIGCMERETTLDMGDLARKTYLAPLTTVGNLPFRRLCTELGAEITCSEMAMATQILKGQPSELSLLKRHPSEKFFGIQLAGGYPDSLGKAVELIKDNFDVDFIDLNLGCPLDCVNEKGGGCSLASRPNKLINVLKCMQTVADKLPISIKMRYGMKEGRKTAHTVIKQIVQQSPPQLLTLHPRSRDQRYTKSADWDYVNECAQAIGGKCPMFVCGDILSIEDYYQNIFLYSIDGIMIGRGALIKPWIFTEIVERRNWDISSRERLDIIKKYTDYALEHWGSDNIGVENSRRFLLEWLSFQHRYIPIGILQEPPQKINQRPPPYRGRDELETLLASPACSDWIKISEMFLGKTPEGFVFVPKHNANAY
ncbi:hypothetical protein ACQ4LE_000575 [Meloidogyne hapla]|uniref:tRNA-dihydrouridine(47) synthase [NAD(P)(+)] n=1 Tax=Meloidogyne hapla TaxID=6305 RepID=A0A1I8C3G9_MELHA